MGSDRHTVGSDRHSVGSDRPSGVRPAYSGVRPAYSGVRPTYYRVNNVYCLSTMKHHEIVKYLVKKQCINVLAGILLPEHISLHTDDLQSLQWFHSKS